MTAIVHDPVNHPNHYTQGDIECIDAIKASMSIEAYNGFLKGNVIKYIWRYQNKGNLVEDLNKANWYLNKLIESCLESKAYINSNNITDSKVDN